MLYCFLVRIYLRGEYMKKNNLFIFEELSSIPLKYCELFVTKDEHRHHLLYENSRKQLLTCLDYANNQFVPPIDREDIASIAGMLHDLNKALYDLIVFKYNYCQNFAVDNEVRSIRNVCDHIYSIFKNGFPNSYREIIDFQITREKQNYNMNKYNPYEMIIRHNFVDKINICLDKADKVLTFTAVTVIKNT